jgi:hypothetical protein
MTKMNAIIINNLLYIIHKLSIVTFIMKRCDHEMMPFNLII